MPRLTRSVPKYRKHRASGQAVVSLNGADHYLGPHGTKASRLEYDRVISEWLVNGRQGTAGPEQAGVSVAELLAGYWQYAKGYYRKNGRVTDTLSHVKVALRFLKEGYSHTQAADFGPLAFKAVRGKMVVAGHSRGYINRQMGHVVRMFKWGVENELVAASVYQALAAVSGLKKGRTEAPDHAPIKPVPESSIQATLPLVSAIVADMIRFQRLTGCRPDEVCIVRPADVDRSHRRMGLPASKPQDRAPGARAADLRRAQRAGHPRAVSPTRGRLLRLLTGRVGKPASRRAEGSAGNEGPTEPTEPPQGEDKTASRRPVHDWQLSPRCPPGL